MPLLAMPPPPLLFSFSCLQRRSASCDDFASVWLSTPHPKSRNVGLHFLSLLGFFSNRLRNTIPRQLNHLKIVNLSAFRNFQDLCILIQTRISIISISEILHLSRLTQKPWRCWQPTASHRLATGHRCIEIVNSFLKICLPLHPLLFSSSCLQRRSSLPAMTLQVSGCPHHIRNQEMLIYTF